MRGTGTSGLRIAVSGLCATYPFGGVFWDYMQYVLGLHLLGHDVLYLEDTGRWAYDPTHHTFVAAAGENVRLLDGWVEDLVPELKERWFVRDAAGLEYGAPTAREVRAFCRSADVFIHLSASCWMRDEYYEPSVVVFLDSDPMYTHSWLYSDAETTHRPLAQHLRHTHFATFGENAGAADCLLPTEGIAWITTRQPLVVDRLRAVAGRPLRRPVVTTVGSWEPNEGGPRFAGRQYHGKSVEFEAFLELPGLSPLPMELALSGRPPGDRLRGHGWRVRNAADVSSTPRDYLGYLGASFAEWSVAKNAYVGSRSGWFSCRSACYLALGVPVVVQNTGFDRHLPSGLGILPFDDLGGAEEALRQVHQDRPAHAAAALDIAEEAFSYRRVLPRLLDELASVPATAVSRAGGTELGTAAGEAGAELNGDEGSTRTDGASDGAPVRAGTEGSRPMAPSDGGNSGVAGVRPEVLR